MMISVRFGREDYDSISVTVIGRELELFDARTNLRIGLIGPVDWILVEKNAILLQANLRYGMLISPCVLQLWVGRFLVIHGKAHGGKV